MTWWEALYFGSGFAFGAAWMYRRCTLAIERWARSLARASDQAREASERFMNEMWIAAEYELELDPAAPRIPRSVRELAREKIRKHREAEQRQRGDLHWARTCFVQSLAAHAFDLEYTAKHGPIRECVVCQQNPGRGFSGTWGRSKAERFVCPYHAALELERGKLLALLRDRLVVNG